MLHKCYKGTLQLVNIVNKTDRYKMSAWLDQWSSVDQDHKGPWVITSWAINLYKQALNQLSNKQMSFVNKN